MMTRILCVLLLIASVAWGQIAEPTPTTDQHRACLARLIVVDARLPMLGGYLPVVPSLTPRPDVAPAHWEAGAGVKTEYAPDPGGDCEWTPCLTALREAACDRPECASETCALTNYHCGWDRAGERCLGYTSVWHDAPVKMPGRKGSK
jgi:hypothetical protein